MSENLVKKVDERGQDNLIARLYPPALTVPVKIAAGSGVLERGTVLSRKDDGTCEVMKAGGNAAYILHTAVDASGSEDVPAVAYQSGNFNPDAVISGEGYELTEADKDALRKYGILFTRMLED